MTVYTMNKENVAWAKFSTLCIMQNKNGAVMGSGDYQNRPFATEISEIIAETIRVELDEDIMRSLLFAIAGDGSADICMVETEQM